MQQSTGHLKSMNSFRMILLLTFALVLAMGPLLFAAQAVSLQGGESAPNGQRAENSASSDKVMGISRSMLERFDLKVRWVFSDMPLAGADRLTKIFYHQGTIFVINDHNRLYAINGENGTIRWTVDMTKHRMEPAPIGYYKESLLFVFGHLFLQVRISDGAVQERIEFKTEMSTSAARTADRIFFGGNDRRFYAVRLSDRVPVWTSANIAIPTGRVTVDKEQVYFVAQNNTLYVSALEDRQLLWKAPVEGKLCGVVVDDGDCFLPSADTALYCFDSVGGKLKWKYLAGESLEELPIIIDQLAFQPVKQKSLLCLNREDGSVRWELKDGKSFLALNGDTTYALTLDNHVTMMNNVTGKRVLSFFAEGVDLHATNQENNLIFLATTKGDLIALQPKH